MIIAMAGDFMAGSNDLPHQRRIAFGHPAENEKCRLDPCFIKQRQHRLAIPLYPMVKPVPVATVDDRLEGSHLKPVLDIDRHGVEQSIRLSRLRKRFRPRVLH